MPGVLGPMGIHRVTLDSLDEHQPLLEAARLTAAAEAKRAAADGEVCTLDQAVLLALCATVEGTGVKDGLTAEQMTAYVSRVLASPQNWMVYSTGLLQKSLLEFHAGRYADRGILQLQAIVEQHTNRLSITQASRKAIEDAAPAHERLAYVETLAYPARWNLQRMLADRMMHYGALRSAADIFETLRMWDRVLTCLARMGLDQQAEAVCRRELAKRPTPDLLCALGDITEDEAHYHAALDLSGGRSGRALRALAVRRFKADDFEGCVDLLKRALARYATDAPSWFLLGIAAMRVEDYGTALSAMTRVLQLDPAHGEAWANASAVLSKLGRAKEALGAVQQAVKLKENSWRMIDNQLTMSLKAQDYSVALQSVARLLALRRRFEGVVLDVRVLGFIAERTLRTTDEEAARRQLGSFAGGHADSEEEEEEEEADGDGEALAVASLSAADDSGDGETAKPAARNNEGEDAEVDGGEGTTYQRQVAVAAARANAFLRRRTCEVVAAAAEDLSSDPETWSVVARVADLSRDIPGVRDAMVKRCRALQRAGWEKDEDAVAAVLETGAKVVEACIREGDKKQMSSAKMYLSGLLRKVKTKHEALPAYEALQAKVHGLAEAVRAMRAATGVE